MARSVFFVEGEFNETDTLTAAAQTPDPGAFPQLADNRRTALKNYFSFLSERTLPAMTVYRSVAEQWELSFPRDALAEHTLGYLPPKEVRHGSLLLSLSAQVRRNLAAGRDDLSGQLPALHRGG